MKTTIEKSVNLTLRSMLNIQKKNAQTSKNEEKTVIYDECGDTLWDDVLAQEDVKNAQN